MKASFEVPPLCRAAFVTFSTLTQSCPHTIAGRVRHCLSSSRHTACTLLQCTTTSFEVPPLGRDAFVTFSTLTRSSTQIVASRLRHYLASSRHTACPLSRRTTAALESLKSAAPHWSLFSTLTQSSSRLSRRSLALTRHEAHKTVKILHLCASLVPASMCRSHRPVAPTCKTLASLLLLSSQRALPSLSLFAHDSDATLDPQPWIAQEDTVRKALAVRASHDALDHKVPH
jgi:hypothetical protein